MYLKEDFILILDYISSLKIIDTHEHLISHQDSRNKNADILTEYFIAYIDQDLKSAGMSNQEFSKIFQQDIDLEERWSLIKPYWENCYNTAYSRFIRRSILELYGEDNITCSNIKNINQKFLESIKKDTYKKILKEKCGIEVSILDSDLNCDRNYFRSTFKLDDFIFPRSIKTIEKYEIMTDMRITCLNDWIECCEKTLDISIQKGAVCLKSNLAYERTLFFDKPTYNDAEKDFNEIFKVIHYPTWDNDFLLVGKNFQDYMMHYVMKLANKRGLVYQIHTGLQAGNGNIISNSDPSLLCNLFLQYKNVKFDLFHIGYPYQNKLSVLAKTYPNVFLDMCWAHIISPAASINALTEWLDVVPINKISGFGGDHHYIDAVLGHLLVARENIAKSLAIKVYEGNFDREFAFKVAKKILYDNPKTLFNL